MFCLIPKQVQEFKLALKDGRINPEKLSKMSSNDRRAFLEGIVGKENAKQVNSLFESKLLLKNQKAGMINWAKKVGGISPQTKRDLISRIERMDNVLNPADELPFMEDLANSRLGFGVTEQEAKNIFDLSQKSRTLKEKANELGEFKTKDARLNYGFSQAQLEDYINELKIQSKKIYFKEEKLRRTKQIAFESIPGTLKSLLSSMDNSFFGRQGIKVLLDLRTSPIWAKNFLKSWGDIGKELLGKDAMTAIKADIYSRPNALNGKYKVGGYGLDVLSEEAFPSSAPARIPVLGRLYKASESAYNGAALRMRADLADRLIKKAEENGVNTLNREEAEGLGHLIGSLTGRGSLGRAEPFAKDVNLFLFSAKLLKANIDTLTAHAFDSKVRKNKFAQKEAAKNLLSMVSTVAGVLSIAKFLDPESVDEDPRSANFGKVKVFGRWTDVTGGVAPIATLASRLLPSQHNGEWGFWTKDKTGAFRNLSAGEYGRDDALDTLENFISGKFSPALGLVRDRWRGRTYSGDKPTLENQLSRSVKPITYQTFEDMRKDPNSSNVLASMILEGLGLSSAPQTYPINWEGSTSKEMKEFKAQVGEKDFKDANERFNNLYSSWFSNELKSEKFKKLSDKEKQKVITKKKTEIKKQVFEIYNFE